MVMFRIKLKKTVMLLILVLVSFFWSEVSGQFGALPTDFGKLSADAGLPRKSFDISQIKPEDALKSCVPGWRENHTYYEDPKCIRYPDFCDYMPRPNPASFAVFTEPFPCFIIGHEVLDKVHTAKEMALSSLEKCMWDYAICFLNACYPGLDPRLLLHLIEIGKLKPKDGKMPQLPINAPKFPGMPSMPKMPSMPSMSSMPSMPSMSSESSEPSEPSMPSPSPEPDTTPTPPVKVPPKPSHPHGKPHKPNKKKKH